MILKDVNLMFNSVEFKHSQKTGRDYAVLNVFDFQSNSPFKLITDVDYANNFKDYKQKQDIKLNLEISSSGNNININIVR